MKKILVSAFAFSLLLTSCKDDDSTPPPTEPDQVKIPSQTVTRSGDDFSDAITTTWQYTGLRVASASDSNGNYREYTYEGLNIKTIRTYLSTGVLLRTEVFFYDGQNRVTTSQTLGSTTGTRYDYTHNADGTIDVVTKTGNATTQTEVFSTSEIVVENGEITSIETTYAQNGAVETYDFTYDDKLKPTKNVLGFDKIAKTITADEQRMGVNHNVTSITHVGSGGLGDSGTRTFTYAGDDYPTMMLHTDSDPDTSYKIEYTYISVDTPSN